MVMDYIEKNIDILRKLAGLDPIKYCSLKRYLECQNIYTQGRENGLSRGKAWSVAARHWNAWANNLSAKRRKLEEDGLWNAKEDLCYILHGKNTETDMWIQAAKVDFSKLTFFPQERPTKICEKSLKNVIYVKRLSFKGFVFPGETNFKEAKFCGASDFRRAEFRGLSDFRRTVFNCAACLVGAAFYAADFRRCTFYGVLDFKNATFNKTADFRRSVFKSEVYFRRATFSNFCSFRLAHFSQLALFNMAHFYGETVFSTICSDKSLSFQGAQFHIVPDFNEATFHAPPLIDEMCIDDQLTVKKWSGLFIFKHVEEPAKRAKLTSRNFRTLGKVAHEARDWQNEMEFFAQEIRCLRFGEDFPFGKNMGRFWFGLMYEKLSNFGRSFARPIIGWSIFTFLLFPLLYFFNSLECANYGDALLLSLRQGMVISGFIRTGYYQELLISLFGKTMNGAPNLGWVYALLMFQTIISTFFLFLFFLAVRNHFRIR